MEVNVAVKEPWARVVRLEADGNVVAGLGRAGANDVAPDGVVVVVDCAACAADDSEDMLRVDHGMSTSEHRENSKGHLHRAGGRGVGHRERRRWQGT